MYEHDGNEPSTLIKEAPGRADKPAPEPPWAKDYCPVCHTKWAFFGCKPGECGQRACPTCRQVLPRGADIQASASALRAEHVLTAKDTVRSIARLRLDASYKRCQYCEASAGGGLQPAGRALSDHEEWCPSVVACRVLGLSQLDDYEMGESHGPPPTLKSV